MTKQEYNEYLKSPEWQHIAAKRRAIDNGRCQMCGTSGSFGNALQCHHLDYHQIGHELEGDFIYTRLVTLCACCHKAIHRAMNRVTNEHGRRGWKDTLSYADHVLEGDSYQFN